MKKPKQKEIPVPEVKKVPTYTRDYLPNFRIPDTYIRSKGAHRLAETGASGSWAAGQSAGPNKHAELCSGHGLRMGRLMVLTCTHRAPLLFDRSAALHPGSESGQ